MGLSGKMAMPSGLQSAPQKTPGGPPRGGHRVACPTGSAAASGRAAKHLWVAVSPTSTSRLGDPNRLSRQRNNAPACANRVSSGWWGLFGTTFRVSVKCRGCQTPEHLVSYFDVGDAQRRSVEQTTPGPLCWFPEAAAPLAWTSWCQHVAWTGLFS